MNIEKLIQFIDARVYVKLEKRAKKAGISVPDYIAFFLLKGVEPINRIPVGI